MRRIDLLILVAMMAALAPLLFAREVGVLSTGAFIGLTFAVVASALALVLWTGARRVRRLRAEFVARRTPLPDDEFLRRMGASGDYARFCLIVRDGFSCDCLVPPETIRPEDAVRQLEELCFDGFFLWEIMFTLEEEFPGRAADLRMLPPFRDWKTITLGQFIERCARELKFL
jgi:hypothetical protein